MSENGLITIRSQGSVKATIDRLEASLRESGVSIFARIDHRAGAISAGMSLRPTEVLIFGIQRPEHRSCRPNKPSASTCR
jgi:uncharacterized protein (DUF302 family)